MRDDERRLTQFLATIAHELRNPLQALSAGIALLKLERQGSATLTTMENQMAHIARLLDDLQDVAQLDHDKLTLRLVLLDARDLVTRVVEATRGRLESDCRPLRVETPSAAVFVRGDSDRLQQVLTNLIVNACKYSPAGSEIELVVERLEGQVQFAIKDRGDGLTPDEMARVFDMFEQVGGRAGARGGLGIGLTLVKKLTERQGGTVAVASEGPGLGSTFTVSLPVWRDEG